VAGKYKNIHGITHLNGDLVCALDTETTGLDCNYHEVVQVAFVILGANFEVDKSIEPFYATISPEYFNRWDPDAARVNGLKEVSKSHGLDKYTVLDHFIDWYDTLPLQETNCPPYHKRLIPLAKNWCFDHGFLRKWFSVLDETNDPAFDRYFNCRMARDLQTVVHYMNDLAYGNVCEYPFNKTSLGSVCKRLDINVVGAHDALADAEMTAAAYSRLINMRMPHGLDFGQTKYDNSVPVEYTIAKADACTIDDLVAE
jgi:DNA polymerase III epsilon subunit-like protein